ncbi:MAG: ATP-binding protein [Candidatus Fermentibacteraceae bacterium]
MQLAISCSTEPEDLCVLFKGTAPGRWPCSIGGRLLEVTRTSMGASESLLVCHMIDEASASTLLSTIRGIRSTILCTSSGRLLAHSVAASFEISNASKTLQSAFEPGSRPAIQAGLKTCREEGRVDDFLVGSSSAQGDRENWIMSLEAVPAPGNLVFCELSIPSLALVNTGGTADSLLETIIEENPSPALVVDRTGIIKKLNGAARSMAIEIYGKAEIQGTYFWKWVAEEYREEAKANHDKRIRGYYAPSRYTLGLKPDFHDKVPLLEISVFPLSEGGDSVAFLSRRLDALPECAFPEAEAALLLEPNTDAELLIRFLRAGTGAESIVLMLPGRTVTHGNAAGLLETIPPDLSDRIWIENRGEWTLLLPVPGENGNGAIALGGLRSNELRPCGELALKVISLLPCFHPAQGDRTRAHAVLEQVSRVMEFAKAGREGFERTLREIAAICGADRAVKAEASSDGTVLLPVVTMGIQGGLPGIPLGSDSIMAWVCVHGKSAFLADPIHDVRMSSVFSDSGSEMAAPIIRGDIVTGVVLLATSSQEGFSGEAMALLETVVGVISALEASALQDSAAPATDTVDGSLQESVVIEIENDLSEASATLLSASGQLSGLCSESGAVGKLIESIRDASGRIASNTSVLVGWLRAEAFGGKPDMRWADPYDTAFDLVSRWRSFPAGSSAPLLLEEPEQRFIACFDPSWLFIALNSLLRIASAHAGPGDSVGVSLSIGSGYWSIQVENSGRGIPTAELPALFKSRSGTGPTHGIQASGLDIPLAKIFTEAMGGTIAVFSSRDRGTRFTLRFKIS